MQLEDSFVVAMPPAAVWAYLLDAAAVAACVPGMVMASVEIVERQRVFTGTAQMQMGGSALRVPTRVEWLEQAPPRGGRLRAEATVAGYQLAGYGTIDLEEAAEGATRFSWSVEIDVPAALQDNPMTAQMMTLLTTRFIASFFTCLRARLEVV
jgi:carbon monoxide dehydrogenase subunit G